MFKKSILPLIIVMIVYAGAANAQDNDPNMGIIPAPVSVKKSVGVFVLSQQTALLADSINNKAVAFFTGYLHNKLMLRNQLKEPTAKAIANSIVFTAKGSENLSAQGYRLTITPQRITIAGKGAGLFYGIQTLIQLMPAERAATAKLPCVVIE